MSINTKMASLLNPNPISSINQPPLLKSSSKPSKSSVPRCSVSKKTEDLGYVKKVEMGMTPIFNIKQYPFLKFTPKTSKSAVTRCSVSEETEELGYGKKGKKIEMGIIGAIAASSIVMGFGLNADATRIEYYATVADPPCQLTYVPSGLGYCDLVVGSGPKAPYNELINVHYTARFADERVFDSSYKRGRPLTMRIGVGKVLRGLDQGIFGGGDVPPMQVGGKRKLRIPPELAYGPEAAGCFSGDCNIPANATLVYDIDFVSIYSGNRKE